MKIVKISLICSKLSNTYCDSAIKSSALKNKSTKVN